MLIDGLDVVWIKQMHDSLSRNRLFEDLAIFEVALYQRLVVGLRTEGTWRREHEEIFLIQLDSINQKTTRQSGVI